MIHILKKIQQGTALTEKEMAEAMSIIMEGGASEAQTGAFLTGLSVRGETSEEISGAARTMREKALKINAPKDAVDCCGTGGDGAGTLNISTAVAFVAAGCGVPVAKHGNRASSSKSGAADVLEYLGVNLEMPVKALEKALKKYNYCFLMAPHHHTATKYVVPVRRQLGFRTIFNLLGPLSNPAGTRRQLLGVYDKKWLLPMAEALRRLGSEKAWIVHGKDGLDEITLTGQTDMAMLENGDIAMATLEPVNFGLDKISPAEIKGGDAAHNAAALMKVLEGEPGAYRDMVVANAAAVLLVHGSEKDLAKAAGKAARSIDSGQSLGVLNNYINFSKQAHEYT
jgi:anthranilate phosphoribosyltransferase